MPRNKWSTIIPTKNRKEKSSIILHPIFSLNKEEYDAWDEPIHIKEQILFQVLLDKKKTKIKE